MQGKNSNKERLINVNSEKMPDIQIEEIEFALE